MIDDQKMSERERAVCDRAWLDTEAHAMSKEEVWDTAWTAAAAHHEAAHQQTREELAEMRAEVLQLEDDVSRYQDACRTGAQSLDEARAEVERLRKLEQSWADACADGVAEAYEERDQARRDAVAATSGGWYDLPSETRDRIATYRKAPDKKSAG
jgi:hypothetical protein